MLDMEWRRREAKLYRRRLGGRPPHVKRPISVVGGKGRPARRRRYMGPADWEQVVNAESLESDCAFFGPFPLLIV
jgi:hypothetical protein